MSEIELGLHAHHASIKSEDDVPAQSPSRSQDTSSSTDSELVEIPFARVNGVVARSPADDSGLRVGDRIRKFGNVNWINHEKLSKIAETVQMSEGVRASSSMVRYEILLKCAFSIAERNREGNTK